MTKIVHLCLLATVSDGFSYQDNLLPKYHRLLGLETTVITSHRIRVQGGSFSRDERDKYINEDGVKIVRLKSIRDSFVGGRLRRFPGLIQTLENESPDILFIHDCQFLDLNKVVRYIRGNPSIRVYMDSHTDSSNSGKNVPSRLLHRLVWRHLYKNVEPFLSKVWCTLPARYDFYKTVYDAMPEKLDILVMGADDAEVLRANKPMVRRSVRERFGFELNDFVVVTGGKIDYGKCQVIDLMDAISALDENVKLLIFGPVSSELKNDVDSRLIKGRIAYVPWANSHEAYDFFSSADAVCFPGGHSVYWEQAVALSKPLIVKRRVGFEHVNTDNNVVFYMEDSAESIKQAIMEVINDYNESRSLWGNAALASGKFLYSDIAKKSIEL